jgi:hypothetical protein
MPVAAIIALITVVGIPAGLLALLVLAVWKARARPA